MLSNHFDTPCILALSSPSEIMVVEWQWGELEFVGIAALDGPAH
jgi:hypothetical protein